jgi:hypothetical protein
VSRTSVRTGVAQLLASLKDDQGSSLFKAVYPVMPPRIDKTLLPAAFVMLPKTVRKRYGPNQKHANYSAQARVYFSAPSVGWQSPAGGSVQWTPPTDEPQTMFDAWLDDLARGLEANKSFSQDVPESGVQVIFIGEPDTEYVSSEPELENELVVLSAIVTFPVAEQLLGV